MNVAENKCGNRFSASFTAWLFGISRDYQKCIRPA